MTEKQEMYIENEVAQYKSFLRIEASIQIEKEHVEPLKEAEEMERKRQADLQSQESPLALYGETLEDYMAQFVKTKKKEIWKRLRVMHDDEIENLVEDYRMKLYIGI